MRRAAFARDGVDALDVLGAEVVQRLGDHPDRFVLADAGSQESVELLVGGIHHRRGLREQPDLVTGLDASSLHEDLLTVDDADALLLQREQDRQLDHVDPERLICQTELLQLPLDLLRHALRDPRVGGEGTPQRRDARTGTPLEPRARGVLVRRVRIGIHLGGRDVEPRVVQRVVLRRRAEVPRDGVAVAGQEAEADELVHRPCADVGRRHVADVREIERQQRAELRAVELPAQTPQAVGAQTVEVDARLPVDGVHAGRSGVLHRCPL